MKQKTILILLLLVGFFVSFLFSGLMFKYELDEVKLTFLDEINVATESSHQALNNLVVADERLRFLFQVTEEVTDEDFLVLSQAVFSQFPYIKRIVYAPKIQRRNLKAEEDKMKLEGYTGFKLRPFSGEQQIKSQYTEILYPVRLIQPYTPYTSVWLGRDLLTFKPAEAVLQQLSNSKKVQITLPVSQDDSLFYAFSSVSFNGDSKKDDRVDFEDVFGVLVYELDFLSLLTKISVANVSREIDLNGLQILRQKTESSRGLFAFEHIDDFSVEGQSVTIRYELPYPINVIDFRIPVLALMLGFLLTILVLYMVKNALERQKILNEQRCIIEDKVKEKTALLEQQASAIKLAFDHQIAVTKELESFSYSISHDLRAPLRSISGFANMLKEDYSDQLDEEGKDMLARVERGAGKMNVLIDDLLNLSKISRQHFDVISFSMTDLVKQELAELCADRPDNNLHISVASDLNAKGDRSLVRIILSNLLGNAIKYSAKVDSPEVKFGTFEMDGKTVYFVKDNGVGFDMTYANKLFVAFQRLHGDSFEGTGIGLATVQRVINRHGGKIWAESELGKGSTFYFTLN